MLNETVQARLFPRAKKAHLAALLGEIDAAPEFMHDGSRVLALAQTAHESGGLYYTKEIWGPTKAQLGYEGRADLGNTVKGDGKRFMGRGPLQCTGRRNYSDFTKWAKARWKDAPDFVANPEKLEEPVWGARFVIWYFLNHKHRMRKDQPYRLPIDYANEGNEEMLTRSINGGLNGYDDRLERGVTIGLAMLGVSTVKTYQTSKGLAPDGVAGPRTRGAIFADLKARTKPTQAPEKPAEAPPVVAAPPAPPPQPSPVVANPGPIAPPMPPPALIVFSWGRFFASLFGRKA